jgi:hypothetical protein
MGRDGNWNEQEWSGMYRIGQGWTGMVRDVQDRSGMSRMDRDGQVRYGNLLFVQYIYIHSISLISTLPTVNALFSYYLFLGFERQLID